MGCVECARYVRHVLLCGIQWRHLEVGYTHIHTYIHTPHTHTHTHTCIHTHTHIHTPRWNVSSVIDMADMFSVTIQFNSSLSNWDVSRVVDMNNMLSFATGVCVCVFVFVFERVCMYYVCMHACMCVCMCVCTCVSCFSSRQYLTVTFHYGTCQA